MLWHHVFLEDQSLKYFFYCQHPFNQSSIQYDGRSLNTYFLQNVELASWCTTPQISFLLVPRKALFPNFSLDEITLCYPRSRRIQCPSLFMAMFQLTFASFVSWKRNLMWTATGPISKHNMETWLQWLCLWHNKCKTENIQIFNLLIINVGNLIS